MNLAIDDNYKLTCKTIKEKIIICIRNTLIYFNGFIISTVKIILQNLLIRHKEKIDLLCMVASYINMMIGNII